MPDPLQSEGVAQWALFLDFDGTLVDIAPTPESVTVPLDLPSLLDRLRAQLGGALGIVSGRPLSEIDAFLAPYKFVAAGLHGLDLRAPGSNTIGHMPALGIDDLRGRATQLIASLPGTVLEDKGSTLALHYRLAPLHAEALLIGARAMIANRPDLHMLPGKMVVEIKPRRADKGNAISHLMTLPPFVGRTPIFIGDDVTDQDGFAAVRGLNGHAVAVGNGAWAQDCARLADPAAVRNWLGGLSTALEEAA